MFPRILFVARDIYLLVKELIDAYHGKDPREIRKHLALAAVEAKRLPEKELRGG
jgi:hypothetical protein